MVLCPPLLCSVTYYDINFTGIIIFHTKLELAKEFCAVKQQAEL
jgi:hypothetical protein